MQRKKYQGPEYIAAEMANEHYELCYENITGIMDANIRAIGKELSAESGREVIKTISSRLKSAESICHKLEKKGLDGNFKQAKENFSDIIGMRIVVMFLDDVYRVAELLKKTRGLTLLNEKDYIQEPKSNGYMSLHLIFQIETYHEMKMQTERFEVQIRTMAMDCWSALGHQMVYKRDLEGINDLQEELRRYSQEIAAMDKRMLEIRTLIDQKQV